MADFEETRISDSCIIIDLEFCDLGKEISVEIYVEDPKLKSMNKLLESFKFDLPKKIQTLKLNWKLTGLKAVRMGVLFPKKTTDSAVIAEAMYDIIDDTSERIWGEIEKISS